MKVKPRGCTVGFEDLGRQCFPWTSVTKDKTNEMFGRGMEDFVKFNELGNTLIKRKRSIQKEQQEKEE